MDAECHTAAEKRFRGKYLFLKMWLASSSKIGRLGKIRPTLKWIMLATVRVEDHTAAENRFHGKNLF